MPGIITIPGIFDEFYRIIYAKKPTIVAVSRLTREAP
ncbi:hypothetical protein SAMN05216235_0952 [Salinicoccus halodurans]|uniref:Uncharacterized protein n=1 Tax=Salinicoccus halodurans TaxID=407035 RepID=A0AA94HDP7_9STAP|nr:hypothetical protein SAMN05216235_0952 [Salinicoccus halodurans]